MELRIGRVGGVQVTLDWSWLLAFTLAVATLVSINLRLLPDLHPAELAFASIAGAAGLLVSLAIHELIRVRALRKLGAPVEHVTLFLVGAVTNAGRWPPQRSAR